MARHGLVEERPPWMCSNKRVDAFCGMGDCPGDKFVRALGMMAIPLEEAPRGLRVGMRPVTELARRLGMMLGPAFERHRPGGCRPGLGGGGAYTGRRRWWRISTGRAAEPEESRVCKDQQEIISMACESLASSVLSRGYRFHNRARVTGHASDRFPERHLFLLTALLLFEAGSRTRGAFASFVLDPVGLGARVRPVAHHAQGRASASRVRIGGRGSASSRVAELAVVLALSPTVPSAFPLRMRLMTSSTASCSSTTVTDADPRCTRSGCVFSVFGGAAWRGLVGPGRERRQGAHQQEKHAGWKAPHVPSFCTSRTTRCSSTRPSISTVATTG
jgi:hypothetical protein